MSTFWSTEAKAYVVCRHERDLKAQGMSKEDIRKPRYMIDGTPDHPGGAKEVECALCPIKRGLFKQTMGAKRVWVHNVCALWQSPEVSIAPVDQPDAV